MNVSVVNTIVSTPAAVDLWSPVVIGLIAVLVMVFKRLVPLEYRNERMLKVMYPMIALVLGPVLDYVFTLVTSHQSGPHAVLFGLVAIGMREFGDQLRKTVAKPLALLVVVVLAGATAGCAGLGELQKFTAHDLDVAMASATANKDIVAADCWSTLIEVQRIVGNKSAPVIVGAASAIQEKRNLLGASGQGQTGSVRRAINRGCAALFMEEARMWAKFGASAFGGGFMVP